MIKVGIGYFYQYGHTNMIDAYTDIVFLLFYESFSTLYFIVIIILIIMSVLDASILTL